MTKTADKNIIDKRDGVGAYGLYLDYILYKKDTGALLKQERIFVVSRLLCTYARDKGNKRAGWNVTVCKDRDDAKAKALEMAAHRQKAGFGVELLAEPLLVELTATDVESVRKNEAPYGRHAAVTAVERMTGKIDDATWRPRTTGAPATIMIEDEEYEV